MNATTTMIAATHAAPHCAACGNDGLEAALYLTIDARWHLESKAWTLSARDDDGGRELDCLACDHRTTEDEVDDHGFPYDASVSRDREAAIVIAAAMLRDQALIICAAQPGFGSPRYRGDPMEAVALQQLADRLDPAAV